MPHSVVEHEPASGSLDGRRRQPNLVCVPPGAAARFQHEPVSAPMAQIRRVRNPHVRSERRHGPMNQRPVSIDSPRQKGGVFVVRRHDDAVALEAPEVFGQSQRHSGATARIRRVSDDVLLQFRHEGDARIFDAPDFFGIIPSGWASTSVRCQFASRRRHSASAQRKDATIRVDLRRGKAAESFHLQQCRARIEHTVDGIGPVFASQDRVGRMPKK